VNLDGINPLFVTVPATITCADGPCQQAARALVLSVPVGARDAS
jgi:hypothetical protein